MAPRWAAGIRLSTTLVAPALALLVVAACFLLAGELSERPEAKVEAVSVSSDGGIYVCEMTAAPSKCGPVADPTWPQIGASACVAVAAVLLLAAAGLSLRARRSPVSGLR